MEQYLRDIVVNTDDMLVELGEMNEKVERLTELITMGVALFGGITPDEKMPLHNSVPKKIGRPKGSKNRRKKNEKK